jgi:hypothetical protein
MDMDAASNVTQLHPVPLAGIPGPLNAHWSTRIDPATSLPQVRAHDAESGVLVVSLPLKLCAGRLDPQVVARMVARIVGEYEGWELLYEAIKNGDID